MTEENKAVSLNIYQRIHAVMKEVDYVQKGEKKVDDKYKFVSHDRVAEIVHEQAVKHGFIIVPDIVESSVEAYKAVDKYNKESSVKDVYIANVKINLRFINIDNPADFFESKGWAGMGIDPQDKAVGKAISYAIKYGLLKVFVLETGDDPDNDQNSEYQRTPVAITALPSPNELWAEIAKASTIDELSEIKEKYKQSINLLKMENPIDYGKIVAKLGERKKEITTAL